MPSRGVRKGQITKHHDHAAPKLHAFPSPACPGGQTGTLPRPPFRRFDGALHGMRGTLLFATGTSKAERHQEGRDAEDDPPRLSISRSPPSGARPHHVARGRWTTWLMPPPPACCRDVRASVGRGPWPCDGSHAGFVAGGASPPPGTLSSWPRPMTSWAPLIHCLDQRRRSTSVVSRACISSAGRTMLPPWPANTHSKR